MLGLFSKNSGPEVTDKVWLSTGAMYVGIAQWLQDNTNGVVAVWFRDDLSSLHHNLPETTQDRVISTDALTTENLKGKQLLIAGHYPLQTTEAAFAENLGLKKLFIFSALDSPLFKRYGGDKIIEVARSMGIKENEGIEHFLVSSAIKKTQGKIVDAVTTEQPANSEAEWMSLNLG